MYTQYPCSAPSGTTVVPPSMITAAQTAASAAIQNGVTSLPQVMQAVTTAVVGAQAQAQAQDPETPIDPNAAPMAVKAGYSTALQGLADQKVNRANQSWLRILQRQPGDFAGMQIPASEFNVPQLDVQLLTTPMLSTGQRAPCVLPGKAPTILPIRGGFGYEPAKAQLTTYPQPQSAPFLHPATPVSYQTTTPVKQTATPANTPTPAAPQPKPTVSTGPNVYANWLKNPGMIQGPQPLSCIMGGIGCKTDSNPTGIGAYRGPFEHLRRRR